MQKIKIDLKKREAAFNVSLRAFSEESVRQAAAAWNKRADIFAEKKGPGGIRLILALKKPAVKTELEDAAKKFLNEILNQEYRKRVGHFNRKITEMIVVRALYSASRPSARDAAAELEPEVARQREAEAQELLEKAREEIQKSQPAAKKIPAAA